MPDDSHSSTITAFEDEAMLLDDYGIARWKRGILPGLAIEEHLFSRAEAEKADLPDWFCFPVNRANGIVVVPCLLFLADRCRLRRGSRAAMNTLRSYAYDFCQWLSFLAREEVSFDEVDQTVFNKWIISLTGGEAALAQSTIVRKASAIKQLYKDARSRGLTKTEFSTSLPRDVGRPSEETIRPISPADIRRLRPVLGPLPSEQVAGDRRPCRLRLCSEIALNAGLRLFEISALDAPRFEELHGSLENLNGETPVRLVVTKGGRTSDAMFPNWLIHEIGLYIEGERSRLTTSRPATKALFVKHTASGRAGGRMSTATLSDDFRCAVRRAGLLRPLPGAHRYGFGMSRTAHTFHDLRHTYAVLSLLSLRGHVADPWNEVRVRMRHATSQITKQVYLRHLHEFERPIEKDIVSIFKGLLK